MLEKNLYLKNNLFLKRTFVQINYSYVHPLKNLGLAWNEQIRVFNVQNQVTR